MAPAEQFLGRVWSVLPWFSVAEVLTALFLAGSAAWLIRAVVLLVRDRAGVPFLRRLLAFGSALLWLWAAVSWMWNAAYYASSFQERSGLKSEPYSVETLAQVTALFAQKAAEFSTQVERDENGLFAESLEAVFDQGPAVYEEPGPGVFLSGAGALCAGEAPLFSRLQSILGFTGVYFPFTGEANVNIDAPGLHAPRHCGPRDGPSADGGLRAGGQLCGHRRCRHQRRPGLSILRVPVRTDSVVQRPGPRGPDAWNAIVQQYFTQEMANDWNANNAYWAELSSPVEETAEQVYDSFLKGNDQELGIRSYGACVDLLVAYFGNNA